MKLIIDANIIFSALISKKSWYLEVFREVEVYSVDFLFWEIKEYEDFLKETGRNYRNFESFVRELFANLKVIPLIGVQQENLKEAMDLCKDIDEKDAPYVALALELKTKLWTNDKKLTKGLKDKGFRKIITSEEVFEMFYKER